MVRLMGDRPFLRVLLGDTQKVVAKLLLFIVKSLVLSLKSSKIKTIYITDIHIVTAISATRFQKSKNGSR